MTRLRANLVSGTITSGVNAVGTTLEGAEVAELPVVASPSYCVVTLEPGTANEEIVYVIAHTASNTQATMSRGREDTTGISHTIGSEFLHCPTALDYVKDPPNRVPLQADYFEDDDDTAWVTGGASIGNIGSTERDHGLYVQGDTYGATDVGCILLPITATLPSTYTMVGRIASPNQITTFNDLWGICLTDGTGNAANIFGAGAQHFLSGSSHRVLEVTGPTNNITKTALTLRDGPPEYFAIRKIGANFQAEYSYDGIGWWFISSQATFGTPTHLGVMVSDQGGVVSGSADAVLSSINLFSGSV